jgi:hypothetical protein
MRTADIEPLKKAGTTQERFHSGGTDRNYCADRYGNRAGRYFLQLFIHIREKGGRGIRAAGKHAARFRTHEQ